MYRSSFKASQKNTNKSFTDSIFKIDEDHDVSSSYYNKKIFESVNKTSETHVLDGSPDKRWNMFNIGFGFGNKHLFYRGNDKRKPRKHWKDIEWKSEDLIPSE
jgi:hypothetical protein